MPNTMTTTISGWTTLAEDPPVLVQEYVFSKANKANTVAIGLPGGGWLIVSPPPKMTAAEAQAFSSKGPVVALLANNGVHHLGLGPCRALFPQAISYATPVCAARIHKKGKDAGELKSIDALQPLLGDKIAVLAVDGSKIGDVVVRVKTEQGTMLYAGDFIANISELPTNFIFKMMFKLTDSAPGLKVFGLFFKVFVKDRAAARDYLIRELEAHPPTTMVPAHGGVVTRPDLAPTLIGMLRAM